MSHVLVIANETAASPAHRAGPARGIHRHRHRCELESELHPVLFPPCQVINDNPVPGLDEYDAAPVRHRIGEAVIRIVLAIEASTSPLPQPA